ncbi:putative Ribosomal protein L24e protein [Trachipleistophora hominis]|uniref:Putative Ribosomal protein L24e protein n=1 Tax=Trachipleistophora hominis TaxID=72359 RepID=L7JWP9_TRAHO|nr:putative Ribosomal protein L24e protein [Trachipleistophora hominis]
MPFQMVTQGKCVFSGQDVPKAKGTYRVQHDGRAQLTRTTKASSYLKRSIKPQKVLWTLGARFFHKKGGAVHKKERERIVPPKIVRGFPCLPKKAVEEVKKGVVGKKEKVEGVFQRRGKIGKNVNVGVRR